MKAIVILESVLCSHPMMRLGLPISVVVVLAGLWASSSLLPGSASTTSRLGARAAGIIARLSPSQRPHAPLPVVTTAAVAAPIAPSPEPPAETCANYVGPTPQQRVCLAPPPGLEARLSQAN